VSTREALSARPATLTDYLRVLRRRKWIVVMLPLTAAVAAYLASTSRPSVYKATAEVYIPQSSLAASLGGVFVQTVDPTRYLANQATIARSPKLASRVVRAPGVPRISSGEFLGQSSAKPQVDDDFIDLSVSSRNAGDAVLLANAYAEQFVAYKTDVDSSSIDSALTKVNKQIEKLQGQANSGPAGADAYNRAIQMRGQLEAFGNIMEPSVQAKAEGAGKVSPRPQRDSILGGVLGLVLGVGLAFFAEALDKRVRSEQEIEEILGIPLLGRVPRPTRRLRKANKLVMLAEPSSVHAQTFRRLRTSLEFINFEQRARMIAVTSALPREGKSTTVANLAVALARAGRDIAVADLDLRRPFLHALFGTGSDHGFSDAVVGRVTLDQAVRPIALPSAGRLASTSSNNGRPAAASENGRTSVESVLSVLPAGSIPPAADEFLESQGVSLVLEELSDRFDLVLLDTPPLLAVGDVMTLSTKVDAIVVVTRLGIHRRQLEELARQLHNCRAPVLGFVLTGASHGDSYSYGYGYDQRVYEVPQETERPSERA
jgi:polysaccharide biosynthesis transport protein